MEVSEVLALSSTFTVREVGPRGGAWNIHCRKTVLKCVRLFQISHDDGSMTRGDLECHCSGSKIFITYNLSEWTSFSMILGCHFLNGYSLLQIRRRLWLIGPTNVLGLGIEPHGLSGASQPKKNLQRRCQSFRSITVLWRHYIGASTPYIILAHRTLWTFWRLTWPLCIK